MPTIVKKHKVSFIAEKKVSEPTEVKFVTKQGKPVDFEAHKKIYEPKKIVFYAKKK